MKAEWTNSDALTTGQTTQSNNFNALNALECVGTQTADVVEIVRCKDCIHYWKNWKDGEPDWVDGVAVCLCSPKDDAFCSEGERREDA